MIPTEPMIMATRVLNGPTMVLRLQRSRRRDPETSVNSVPWALAPQ